MLKIIALLMLSTFSCQDPGVDLGSELSLVQPSIERVYIRLPRHMVSPNFVKYTRFIRDSKQDNYYAFGYLPKNFVDRLPDNYRREVTVVNRAVALTDFDPKTLEMRGVKSRQQLYNLREGYHDYAALTSELQTIAANYGHITDLTSVGKSVQGRELWMLKISDNPDSDDLEPKLLYIANMHGDEVVGRELMIYMIRLLTSQYGKSQRVTDLVNNSQIYIIPSMNPDGFEKGSRFNARGSDLNRNFPDFTSDPNDSPNGRQVETQAIMRLHEQHHFVLAINFHGGAECFNLPWDTKPNSQAQTRFGDDPLLRVLGRAYTKSNTDMYNGSFDKGLTYGYEWYEVNGGLQDWANYYRRSIHATVELSNAKWPSASQLSHFWQMNEQALFNYLEAGLVGFHLKLVDPAGNVIATPSRISNESANRTVVYDNGVLHRPALPVKQKVQVQAQGYQAREIELTPWKFDGRYQEVVLTPGRR